MLFDWPKEPLPREYDGWNYDPWRSRKCPACGFVAPPRMTGIYRFTVFMFSLFGLMALWFLPWFSWETYVHRYSPGANKLTALFVLVVGLGMLVFGRNAYRCAKCDGILW